MMSSNGNIFHVAGPLCGEFTGDRWIPLTKASRVELWCFLWSAPWVNNREASDLRCHRAYYAIIAVFPNGFHSTSANWQTKHQMIMILTNPTSDIWILRLTWQTCWRDFVKTVIVMVLRALSVLLALIVEKSMWQYWTAHVCNLYTYEPPNIVWRKCL